MAAALLLLSAALYFIHFRIFGNPSQTLNYLLGNIAFLPFEVLIVTLITAQVVDLQGKRARFESLTWS